MTMFVFILSAAIAGLGGAFYAMSYGNDRADDFNYFFGPTFLVIVVTVGVDDRRGRDRRRAWRSRSSTRRSPTCR